MPNGLLIFYFMEDDLDLCIFSLTYISYLPTSACSIEVKCLLVLHTFVGVVHQKSNEWGRGAVYINILLFLKGPSPASFIIHFRSFQSTFTD